MENVINPSKDFFISLTLLKLVHHQCLEQLRKKGFLKNKKAEEESLRDPLNGYLSINSPISGGNKFALYTGAKLINIDEYEHSSDSDEEES